MGSSVHAKNSGVGCFYVSQLTSCRVREQKKKSLIIYRRIETILCLSVLFMLTSTGVPFYACRAFLCLSARTVPLMLVGPFSAYQTRSCSIHAYQCGKNEINLSRNDGFFYIGLSGSISPPAKINLFPFRFISLK